MHGARINGPGHWQADCGGFCLALGLDRFGCCFTMLCKRFNQGHVERVGRPDPVRKGLEHVGFGNKTVDVAHRAVAAEESRTLEVGVPAFLGRGAPVVDVGNHRESHILHAAVDIGF